ADLVGVEPEVDGNEDAPEAADAKERDEEPGGVGRDDRHPFAPAHAEAVEGGSLCPGPFVDLVPGQRAQRTAGVVGLVDDADPVAIDVIGPLQKVTNCKRHAHIANRTPTVPFMRAVTIVDQRIEVREHPDPEPAKGELVVRVRAAGVNAADLMQVQGFYPAPPGSPADIPGLEFAGEVAATGPGVTRFGIGDRVASIVGGGAQAELAVVHERLAMPMPATVDWPEAGGFPEVFLTAHDALFTQAGLQPGDRALVHGAAGGVGTAGVQLAAAAGA